MGTNEYSQPASKSSWDSQDFGDVNMVVKMAHFHKSSRPQWVKRSDGDCVDTSFRKVVPVIYGGNEEWVPVLFSMWL